LDVKKINKEFLPRNTDNQRMAWSQYHPGASLMLPGGTKSVSDALEQKQSVSSLDSIIWRGRGVSNAGRAVGCER